MDGESDSPENLWGQLDWFFTCADLAATRLQLGYREAAEQAIADAEKGYQSVSSFLTDAKHVSHLSADELNALMTELQRLRERLDGLKRSLGDNDQEEKAP